MSTDVEIYIFDNTVNCDRYHLLKVENPTPILSERVEYSESGNAFNGFNNPFILNVNYDRVKYSRMCAIRLKGMNIYEINGQTQEQPIFCLINNIEPLRNDKTVIEIEPDAWMNYRREVKIGDLNTLYSCTRFIPECPFQQHKAKFKTMTTQNGNVLFGDSPYYNIIAIRHREARTPGQGDIGNQDEDWIYYLRSSDSYYKAIHTLFWYFFTNNIDTNQLIALFVSPFELKLQNT